MGVLTDIEPVDYLHLAVGALGGALFTLWAHARRFRWTTVFAVQLLASLVIGIVAVAQIRWPELPLWAVVGMCTAASPLSVGRVSNGGDDGDDGDDGPAGLVGSLRGATRIGATLAIQLAACVTFALIGAAGTFGITTAADFFI